MKFKSILTCLCLMYPLQSLAGTDEFRAADVDDSSFNQTMTSPSKSYVVKVPYSSSEVVSVSISDVRYRKDNDVGNLNIFVSVKSEDLGFLYSNTFVSKVVLDELDMNWVLNTFRLKYHIHSIEPQHSFEIREEIDNSVIGDAVKPYLIDRLNNMEFSIIDDNSSFMNSLSSYYLRDMSGDLHIAIKP